MDLDKIVENCIEHRNDDPKLSIYWCHLDGKTYAISYYDNKVKEVYFMDYLYAYFMSCRVDMETISHYYMINTPNEKTTICRYENGVMNRVYTADDNYTTWYCENNKKIIYKRVPYEVPNKQQIYNDLVAFLDKFNKLGLYKHFHRERPE